MNPILNNLVKNARKKEENNSAPPFMGKIRTEKQDRPLPDDLMEQCDIPYGDAENKLFANVVYPRMRTIKQLPVIVFVHGGALVTGDRKADRVFCQEMARRGFVVYSVEYRLIDRSDAFGMVSDLCSAMLMVKDTVNSFGGDAQKVSICAESAGAFLSIYTVAVSESEKFCRMFGCRQHGLKISHLILFSGMIYTSRRDVVSLVYKDALYGEKAGDDKFFESIDPDNPAVLSLLPPVFLVSSGADFLRMQTLKFGRALRENRHGRKLMFYKKGKELTHAFPVLCPSLPESAEVIDAVSNWIK